MWRHVAMGRDRAAGASREYTVKVAHVSQWTGRADGAPGTELWDGVTKDDGHDESRRTSRYEVALRRLRRATARYH